jgi:hypothetical protein
VHVHRCQHQHTEGVAGIPDVLGEMVTIDDVFIIASPRQCAARRAPDAAARRVDVNTAGIDSPLLSILPQQRRCTHTGAPGEHTSSPRLVDGRHRIVCALSYDRDGQQSTGEDGH